MLSPCVTQGYVCLPCLDLQDFEKQLADAEDNKKPGPPPPQPQQKSETQPSEGSGESDGESGGEQDMVRGSSGIATCSSPLCPTLPVETNLTPRVHHAG